MFAQRLWAPLRIFPNQYSNKQGWTPTTLQKMCLKTNALWVRDFVPPHSHAWGSADGNLWRSKWPPSPLWSSMSQRTAPCPAALMPASPCLATPRPRWWCVLFFSSSWQKITLEVEKFRLQSFPFPIIFYFVTGIQHFLLKCWTAAFLVKADSDWYIWLCTMTKNGWRDSGPESCSNGLCCASKDGEHVRNTNVLNINAIYNEFDQSCRSKIGLIICDFTVSFQLMYVEDKLLL